MTPTRRGFLRAAGISLALPWLEALAPKHAEAAESGPRRRMVCLCAPLGLHAQNFFPQKTGKDYPLSPYLEILREHRNDFTVMSGLCHPDVA